MTIVDVDVTWCDWNLCLSNPSNPTTTHPPCSLQMCARPGNVFPINAEHPLKKWDSKSRWKNKQTRIIDWCSAWRALSQTLIVCTYLKLRGNWIIRARIYFEQGFERATMTTTPSRQNLRLCSSHIRHAQWPLPERLYHRIQISVCIVQSQRC